MDPRRLLTFRAVAHQRSFSAAARALALTQPAVSQQVAALERQLGTRLLDREPGGLRLTRAGEVLLAHADVVAERLELADAQLAELARDTRLRVGAFPSALAALVPTAVARLRETVAGAEATVEEGGTDELAQRVRRGRLHLALGFQDATLPRREHPGTERRDLLREPFLAALWPGHPLAARAEVPLAALADEPWVAPSDSGMIARACTAAGFTMRLTMISRDPLANRALIARGLAVTLVPALLAGEFGGVELRPLAGDGPRRDVYALLPPGGRHPLVAPALAALTAAADGLRSGPACTAGC
jgi:DNA-binding transcriptional LysR family regulator